MIRVLIINRQLVFAVTIKQALEQTGEFEVHPFTSSSAALELLRGHPHDVVLLDFTVTGTPGPEIVRQLRLIQPDIPIIVSPTQPGGSAFLRDLDLQGMLNMPFDARTIIPMIKQAVLVEDDLPEDDDMDTHTRILGSDSSDVPPETVTRIFDDDDDADGPPVDVPAASPPPADPHTRILDEPTGTLPPLDLPEFSTLDDVLADEQPSEMYEPPVGPEDTPAVPDTNSEALRQFLATKMDDSDSVFDELLSDIDAMEAAAEAVGLEGGSSEFADLVNSMRGDVQHTPLPDRQEQFFEFILTGGMDSLLTEIEKRKTGPLEDPDAPEAEIAEDAAPPPDSPTQPEAEQDDSVFQKLAEDEPPMPSFEDSGTIGDLMIGVSDTSFRNVLALMRGDEGAVVDESTADAERRAQEADEVFASFFDEGEDLDDDDLPQIPSPLTRDRGSSIPAQLILETAMDESTPPESFSLDSLIESIEQQLSTYKPDVSPLPSWGQRAKLPRPELNDRYVREPDFLPEEFPSSEELMPPKTLPEAEAQVPPPVDVEADEPFDFDALDQVTQASAAQQMEIDAGQQDETEALPEHTALDDLPADEDYLDTPEADIDWPDAEPLVSWEDFTPPAVEADAETETEADDWAEPEEPPLAEEQAYFGDLFEAWPDDEATVIGQQITEEGPAPADDPFPEPDFLPELPRDDFDMLIDESPDDATVMLDRSPEAVDLGPGAAFDVAVDEFDVATDDPYIAQLALSLTQVSLELAAEATLLTRDGEIVAFAGQLPEPEMDELRNVVTDEWEGSADQARVRFIKLAVSGNDYMLYSRKTDGDFTLWMIFAGAMPLREIRKQGKRLVDVLEAVPEVGEDAFTLPVTAVPPAPEAQVAAVEPAQPAVPVDAETLSPYTYVWLLNDPDLQLPPPVVEAIRSGLQALLTREGWQVRNVRVQGEYVYLLAEVPGERAAYEVINDLKGYTTDIIRRQAPQLATDDLWADSYLVVTPGRELEPDEIAQFISFERLL